MAKPSVALRLGLEGEESITSGFERIAASGDAAAKRLVNDFQRAGQDIDRALSQQAVAAQKLRIVTGKDVQTGENQNAQIQAFRAYRQEMELQARQAAALRDALNPLAVAQRRYAEEVATYDRLLRSGNILEEEHAEAVRRSTQALELARAESTRGIGSDNARRAAMQNLGFQFQDFAVQVVGGTSVLRAFAQQAPQAAGALTGFGGKLSGVAAFLGGPWGIALTLGTTVVAGFADKLLSSGDAGDAGKAGLDRYSNSLAVLRQRAAEAGREIAQLNATAGQRRVDQIAESRNQLSLAQARLAQLEEKASASGTRAALQQAAEAKAQLSAARDAVQDSELQLRIRTQNDLQTRREEAAARAAIDTRKDEIASRKAAAEARRAETKAARDLREANEAEQASMRAAYAQRLSEMVTGAGSIATGADPRAALEAINRYQDRANELLYERNKARIAGVAEFYRAAFTNAGQSAGQAFKAALLDAVFTALAKLTVSKASSLFDSAGSLLNRLGGGAGSKAGFPTGLSDTILNAGPIGRNAAGTNYFSGGATWVAENGPELINLPRGTRITNAADTRRMLAAPASAQRIVVHVEASPYFDARVTQVAAPLADVAVVRGAAGGSQMAQAEMRATEARRLGRRW